MLVLSDGFVCAKIYPHGRASGHLHRMAPGDTIDCFVHRKVGQCPIVTLENRY
jgi:hypothetical protein